MTCEHCSHEFTARRGSRFCSRACANGSRKRRRPCEQCGAPVRRRGRAVRFCSHACATDANVIPLRDRLLAFVVTTERGCWQWTGSTDSTGYGKMWVRGQGRRRRRPLFVHRVAYEEFVGPIPEGMQIDHLCRNRGCCNPEHLEAVTPAENTRRAKSWLEQLARSCPLCACVSESRNDLVAHLVAAHGAQQ